MVMNTGAVDYRHLSSVMAERSFDKTSSKYAFVPTFKVIELMERNGWVVSSAREAGADRERQGFQKHMIRFRRQGDVGKILQVDELIPEIQLTNSHDAGSCFNLMAALYRCWCSNQCTVSDSTLASHRVRHVGFNNEKILEAVHTIAEDTPKVLDRVKDFKSIALTAGEQAAFAEGALQVINPLNSIGEDGTMSDKFDKATSIARLLEPKRPADKENNLWNTYNRIQEKAIKGDRFMIEQKKLDWYHNREYGKKYAKANKTRQVKSIDKDVKLNKALWTLTEKMAEIKAAAVA